jgi:hypothetical protein
VKSKSIDATASHITCSLCCPCAYSIDNSRCGWDASYETLRRSHDIVRLCYWLSLSNCLTHMHRQDFWDFQHNKTFNYALWASWLHCRRPSWRPFFGFPIAGAACPRHSPRNCRHHPPSLFTTNLQHFLHEGSLQHYTPFVPHFPLRDPSASERLSHTSPMTGD